MINYTLSNFDGTLSLTFEDRTYESTNHSFKDEDNIRDFVFDVNAKKHNYENNIDENSINENNLKQTDTICLDVDFETISFQKKSLIFIKGDQDIKHLTTEVNGININSADNGCIKISASQSYAHGIHSITYKGQEWLDSLFPKPGPKSWWNPWVGGITTQPQELTNLSILKEKRSVNTANIMDNMGNHWQGICITLDIQENEKFKGLILHQYFLMLPGVPVICCTTEIIQNTNTLFNYKPFVTMAFFKPNENIKESWYKVRNREGNEIKYKAGRVRQDTKVDSPICFGTDTRNERLLVIPNPSSFAEGIDNNQVMGSILVNKVILSTGNRMFLPPMFLLFTEDNLEASLLKDLYNIKF